MRPWRIRLTFDFGPRECDHAHEGEPPHDSELNALVERSEQPYAPPIGFSGRPDPVDRA